MGYGFPCFVLQNLATNQMSVKLLFSHFPKVIMYFMSINIIANKFAVDLQDFSLSWSNTVLEQRFDHIVAISKESC